MWILQCSGLTAAFLLLVHYNEHRGLTDAFCFNNFQTAPHLLRKNVDS